ncbi:hypothetical protein HU200_011585 [Digitaria exilis]|uniref:Uncharacterized protein n=1 Tax=Digitaria exilis TaxID=1010633 RepID=A0A835FG51_9POAL|nr:hypothetical protein HU200_011585 [Digitaria exilis]
MASSSSSARIRPTPVLSSTLVYLTFSHDGSCIIAADSSAVHWLCYKSFRLRGLYQERDAGTKIVAACGDMLDEKASTCAVVTRVAAASSQDTFVVRRWKPGYMNYHWRYDERVIQIEAGAAVRAVHVHGDRTVVVHDGRVDVYGPDTDGGVLHRVETRGGKPICAVSRDGPLAFACAGAEVGEAHVERWLCDGEFAPLSFAAHSSRLECVAMSWDGRLVATASFKGTMAVTANGDMLRRGADRAKINSMAFSPDSKWLAVSSDKGTIHIFHVAVDLSSLVLKGKHDPDNQDVNQGSYWQECSLAKFRLREGKKYLVTFSQEPNIILIIGIDGSFYRVKFDPVNAGEMEQLECINFMKIKLGS